MNDVLSWHLRGKQREDGETQRVSATAAFGRQADEPVLIGAVHGPVEIEMAKDALSSAGLPAYVKQNSLGPIYGLSIGSFGTAEVWVMPAVAERARELLEEIGLLGSPSDNNSVDFFPEDEENS